MRGQVLFELGNDLLACGDGAVLHCQSGFLLLQGRDRLQTMTDAAAGATVGVTRHANGTCKQQAGPWAGSASCSP
jgi:hypothetical protein